MHQLDNRRYDGVGAVEGLVVVTNYLVFLATGTIELEADLVREISYVLPIEGQQPTVVFYEGYQSADKIVAKFVLKNIGGYCKAADVKKQLDEGTKRR